LPVQLFSKPFRLNNFFANNIRFIIIVGFIIMLSSIFLEYLYAYSILNFFFLIFLTIVVFCSIYSIKRYGNFKSVYGFLCFIMPSVKFYENIKASIQQNQKLRQLKQLPFEKLNQSSRLELLIKKNIFFIGVESYGSLIYDAEKFPDFSQLAKYLEGALHKNDWKVSSAFSESPISGGASWLSYSTLLKGMHIDSESIYSYLFSDEIHLSYQPFMQRLQNNGFDNLSYSGKHFGFGPSPPDQYSLHKAHAIIKEKATKHPFALFWLTLNSHYPWDSPEKIVDNWQLLNQKQDKYWVDSDLNIQKKYEKAMIYQLQFLIDFILKKGTENDVFILVGDHQPFHIGEIENTNTPLHIISKDKQFIRAFDNYDFSNGLLLKSNYKNTLKHAGIQSLLIKVLNQIYGNSTTSTYYKNGINEF